MPKSPTNDTPDAPRTNPSVDPQTSTVNPSAPTAGTEAWGNTSDERKVMGNYQPAGTRAGLGDLDHERKGDPGGNQADLSRRTSGSAHSMNTSQGGSEHSFRCADAGNADCHWETGGDNEDAVMRRVEEHWRNDHAGMGDWTAAMRNRVRENIRRREAA